MARTARGDRVADAAGPAPRDRPGTPNSSRDALRAASATRRSEAARRAILIAAFELVGEVGYEKLTIEGIAARAGVGKQTIYRWWPSKGAVLFDAILAFSEDQEGKAALPDSGNLAADLKLVLRATVAELVEPRYDRPMRALTSAMLNDPALTAEFEQRLDQPMRAIKRARLTSAQEAGQLPADTDLDLAIELLWSPLWKRWQDGRELTPAFAEAVVDTVLAGLRAG